MRICAEVNLVVARHVGHQLGDQLAQVVGGLVDFGVGVYWLSIVCAARGVPFEPRAIWERLEMDDVLAVAVARLMLFTDSKRLLAVDDAQGGWALYARAWRPGKPHPETWGVLHARARDAVAGVFA